MRASKLTAGGGTNVFGQKASSAIAFLINKTAANSLLGAIQIDRERQGLLPYSFYENASIVGKAFAHSAATTQIRYQYVDLEMHLTGDLSDLAQFIDSYNNIREDWSCRFNVITAIGTLASTLGLIYSYNKQEQSKELSFYEETEIQIEQTTKISENINSLYTPEVINSAIRHLLRTGNIKVTMVALVEDFLHQNFLDKIFKIQLNNEFYHVHQKIVKLTLHLNSFENKIRELSEDPAIFEKLEEYIKKIKCDLIELEATLSVLPSNGYDFSQTIDAFKTSLSLHTETLNILTPSLKSEANNNSNMHSEKTLEHARHVSVFYHAQFNGLHLKDFSASRGADLSQSNNGKLLETFDSTSMQKAMKTELRYLHENGKARELLSDPDLLEDNPQFDSP